MKKLVSKINYTKLVASVAICELAGIFGSIFTSSSLGTWYQSLIKPSFTPPGYFIGTVWIMIYFLIGLSLYFIWNKQLKQDKIKTALGIFSLQLIANALWSFLFFGLQSALYGMVGIAILWILIIVNIITFYKVEKKSAYLLLPYIIWVTFAMYLNYSILILNI